MSPTEDDRTSGRVRKPSLGDALKELFSDAADLARSGFQMATAEVSRTASKAGKGSRLITIGAFVTYAGFLFILASAVFALSLLIPVGWAVFAVGTVTLIAGMAAIYAGKRQFSHTRLPLGETIESLKEDAKWMRNQLM
jgi:hypothetical protein